MTKSAYQSLLDYAFRILSRKNYTESEMVKKLSLRSKRFKLDSSEEATKKVIERLHELNYINDEKILENYFEYSLEARPQGKFGFLQTMRRRGIRPDEASSAWIKRKIDEKAVAKKLIEKKRLLELPLDIRRKKIASLLAGRGFSPETIWSILDQINFKF